MTSYAKYWNPLPIVTHVVDEDGPEFKTLCGLTVEQGWDSGDAFGSCADSASDNIGCLRCRRVLQKRIALVPVEVGS